MAKNVAAELYSAYTAGQINSMDSIRTLVGDTIYSVIGDYLTIYSYTANIDKHKKSRVDVNHATAKQIFDKLQPTLGDAKAAQLAVSLVDFRDSDSIPTLLTVAGTTYRGVEQNPYINEVMPYSSTPDEDGNDGQYIELYNPYNETLLLDGWKIEGTFGSIDLYGQIPPQAYLIITDEYTDDAEYDGGTPDGYCFLKNYGSVPTSQLVVNENLSLSITGDTLRLYDSSGNLTDEVVYEAASKNVSWEKNDPRVNTLYTCNGGTPYQRNAAYSPPEGTADESAAMIITNQSFGGIGDLGYVCAALPSHPWTTISIGTDTTGIRFADIIDLLSVTTDDKIVGQININTAPADVLMALPGMTPALSEEIVNYRTVYGKFNQITDLANISGFLGTEKVDDNGDGSVDEENEQQSLFRQMADWITTRSNVFKIRSIGTTNKNGIPITTSSIEVVIDRSKEPVKTLFRKRINP
jgi:DNA uptake protein ComE-like DNA-binding protein